MLNPDGVSDSEIKLCTEFTQILKFSDGFFEKEDTVAVNDDVRSEEEEEEGEFSFVCGESNSSPIAAEDAFINGQIKPVFPFFSWDFAVSAEDFPFKPPANKVFVETEEWNNCRATSSAPGNDEIVGPYCDWSDRKAVEVSASGVCKKSNSTGFSKIWRFKELMSRSNSDGRDTFVFLNVHAPPQEEKEEAAKVDEKVEKKKAAMKGKTTSKSKTAPLSPHEVYLKSKAKEGRRRSYLPYRPELMGFFTNVNSGLSKNVHPY